MNLHQLNEYKFLDKNRDKVKVGDAILFKKDGMGGKDGWTKGIINKINGSNITVQNLEASKGEATSVTVKSWKKIDKS